MEIRKLTASFGKLEGESLSFGSGLNVITAPNESGKSTWCAFIRAMLYGVDSSQRQKAGFLPDKTKYAPWSGAPMQGSMEIEKDGREMTLVRTTKTASAPMRNFSAVYTGTNVAVDGLTGANAGEMLTGVGSEVFRRSAFIEQGKIAVTHSPELEKRINAIVTTGDENCSYTQADERLRQWQRARRFNRRGKLPELEDKIAQKMQLSRELERLGSQAQELTAELENEKEECRRLEEEVTESRKNVRKEALSNLMSVRSEVESAAREHEQAQLEFGECLSEVQTDPVGRLGLSDAESEIGADIEKARGLKKAAKQKASPAMAIIAAVLAAALAVLGFVMTGGMAALLCAAGVALAAAVWLFASYSKKRAAAADAAEKRRRILEKYAAQSEDELRERLGVYLSLCEKLCLAREKQEQAAKKLAAARSAQTQEESRTLADLDFAGGDSYAAQLGRRLAQSRARCSEIASKLAEQNGYIAAVGDPVVLGSEISELTSQHDRLEKEYAAITLAVETLRAADADIQSRFSPELGRLAAEYMHTMTGGKYDAVMLDRDFTAAVRENGGVPRAGEYLSAGTLDLLYLAVRLAVCKLALPQASNCPLILDDVLVNFDAERTQQAMKLLEDIARQRQVILFTCK